LIILGIVIRIYFELERTVFLKKLSEENLDGFSHYFGFKHKDLFGNPILVEVNPAES